MGKVLQAMEPEPSAETVVVDGPEGSTSLAMAEVLADDKLRLFTIVGEKGVTFAVARMDGEVIAARVSRIEVE